MPRSRRRRLKRQRKKWGVQPKLRKSPFVYMQTPVVRNVERQPLSRIDILALAASAKNPAERRRYRKMLEK
jgi:hypothetical protein